MVDWLEIFLSVTPWMAWFFAIGIPWAFVLLPRVDWHDKSMVLATGLALGPLFGSLWLFALGTFGTFSFAGALLGTVGIAAIGSVWAFSRAGRSITLPPDESHQHAVEFRGLQYTLALMILIGLLANVWDTAFWPFLRYDTLWTFGYNPKIFMLEGHIPDTIDYYPQLVPLTFTFATLAHGEFSDYAARTAIPWFMLSSVLAAYALGWRLYGRRIVGMVTAALWLLTPAVLVWSSSGDLEHPMAIYFSLAALFVVLAWRDANAAAAQRYAVLAGLMLGAAMWTKPTAGAFIFGMGLLATGQTAYSAYSGQWARWRQRVWLLIVLGLVAAPIGGVWYVRNILVGHSWTNLPADYWTGFAQRSGMQLNWLYYIALLAVALVARHAIERQQWLRVSTAISAGILLSAAILPTMLSLPPEGLTPAVAWNALNGFREPTRSLNTFEVALILVGVGLLAWSGFPAWREVQANYRQAWLLSWGLGLPFFVVYFWSFSYHYRLALTVLPIILATLGALLVQFTLPFLTQNAARRWGTITIVVLLCIPAPIAATYHTALNTLNDTGIDTTREKYQYANPALLDLVAFLERHTAANDIDHLRILAPGENRLAFFFPEWEIDDTTLPTDVEDLHGYDVFVDYVAEFLWREAGLYPNITQAWTDIAPLYPLGATGQPLALDGPQNLPQPRLLRPIMTPIDDGVSRYEVYAIDTTAPYAYVAPETRVANAIFGETMQLLGYDLPTQIFTAGETYTLKVYWRGTEHAPPPSDYSIYLHLTALDDPTQIFAQADGGLLYSNYPTRFLTPHMTFQDRRNLMIPLEVAPGRYQLRIGVYDPQTFVRLPLTVDGEPAGDGWTFVEDITVTTPDHDD